MSTTACQTGQHTPSESDRTTTCSEEQILVLESLQFHPSTWSVNGPLVSKQTTHPLSWSAMLHLSPLMALELPAMTSLTMNGLRCGPMTISLTTEMKMQLPFQLTSIQITSGLEAPTDSNCSMLRLGPKCMTSKSQATCLLETAILLI